MNKKTSDPDETPEAGGGTKTGPDALPARFSPQLASSADGSPPAGENWLHEIKFDGYRAIVRLADGEARILTRNGLDWTERYGDLANAFTGLACSSCLIDGEVVATDESGISRLSELQNALSSGEAWKLAFYAFDLVHLDGHDLSAAPLLERKALLAALLKPVISGNSPIQLSEHMIGQGPAFFKNAAQMGLEGIISKRSDSRYEQGRSKTWLKSKATQTGRFTIIGFTEQAGGGGLGALVLAEETPAGLEFVGKAGTGFSANDLDRLVRRLGPLQRKCVTPRLNGPKPKVEKANRGPVRWIEPDFQATVEFADRSADNHLRNAVYRSLVEPDGEAGPEIVEELISEDDLATIWVSHPDRVMFEGNATKLDIALYYARVGNHMLPHLLGRPVSLIRCPTGVTEDCFFQRHPFRGMPDSVTIFNADAGRKSDKADSRASDRGDYLAINDARAYLGLAQFGAVEFHTWGCRADNAEQPDRMIFDLDPGQGVAWRDIIEAAGEVRNAVEAHGLTAFVKTSGGKGVHVVTPLNPGHSWDGVRAAGTAIVAALAKSHAGTFTAKIAKQVRRNRIYLDVHGNLRAGTLVAPYSLRSARDLPVSTPLGWDKLNDIDLPQDLNYVTVPGLLINFGDAWREIDACAATLPNDLTGT